MAEWIGAERRGSMLRVFEHLLAPGAKGLRPLKGGVYVFHMEIEVHRSPVTLERASIMGIG